jgi:hypothetical protein
MTIHTVGDSHSQIPFLNAPNTVIHYLGPITLKRAGHPSENLLIDTVAHIYPPVSRSDTLLFCLGEIDVRCWVHVHVTKRQRDLEELLNEWITLYLDKIAALSQMAKIAVLAVVPPAPQALIDRDEFPVAGSDQERVLYTRRINHHLRQGCAQRNFVFVDLSAYEDPQGMINPTLRDGSVHIADNSLLLKAIADLA